MTTSVGVSNTWNGLVRTVMDVDKLLFDSILDVERLGLRPGSSTVFSDRYANKPAPLDPVIMIKPEP